MPQVFPLELELELELVLELVLLVFPLEASWLVRCPELHLPVVRQQAPAPPMLPRPLWMPAQLRRLTDSFPASCLWLQFARLQELSRCHRLCRLILRHTQTGSR